MTVEAKLRVRTDLKDARAQVQGLENDLREMRKAGTDKTNRGEFENLRASLRQAKEATRELTQAQLDQQKAANKATIQNVQLSAQLQDFFVQVQAGGSPLTAFIQQGSQLSFIYGGAGNALKAVTALFTPLRIAAGAAAAGVGLLAAAYLGGEKQSNDFARSLVLTGGYAGTTAGQFEDMAARVSRAVGSSIGGAKETIQGLISTGKFTSTALEPVATAIEKVSALTGQTREDVIKDFSAMAEGGVVKFAEKLNSSYNFLDLATYRYIKTLQEQGRETEAQVALVNALNQSLGSISANLGTLERAWKSIKDAASSAWDAFLGIGRTATVEDRVASATKALELAQQRVAKNTLGSRADGGRAGQRAIAEAQAELDAALEAKRIAGSAALQIASIKEVNKEKIEADKRVNKQLEEFASKEVQRKKALAQLDKDIALNKYTPEQQKILRDGINEKFKDKGSPQLTRLAQTKQLYDKELELANDASNRELKLLQDQYNSGLVTLEFYLGRKAALQDADFAQDIARLNARLKAEQATLATNTQREAEAKKRGDKNGIEQAQEANLATRQKIAELETQIVIKQRDQNDAASARLNEERKITQEITRQFALFEIEARKQRGERLSPEDAAKLAFERRRQLFERLGVVNDTEGQQIVLGQVNREAKSLLFDDKKSAFDAQSAALRNQEEAIRLEGARAGESELQIEKRLRAAREQQIPVLEKIRAELAALAQTDEERNVVDGLALDIERLRQAGDKLSQSFRGEVAGGLSQVFKDVVTGAKSGKDAVLDFVRSIANSMLDLIAQDLGKRLAASLLPSGSGGGGGSFLQAVFSLFGFHSGGVVRSGGQTFTRSIPAGLAMAAAQYAPRYHTGGIAGFKPNERLAVLEKGEEVLTADNPRHINNMQSRGGVSVQNKFVINGASGDAAQKQTALDDLSGQMEVLIDQWSMKQQRPGGILFKGGR